MQTNNPLYLILCLGCMGAIGAISRWAISQLISHSIYPIPTIVVNTVGSFLLGLLTTWSWKIGLDTQIPTEWRIAICTGFLGAFTTFSTFSVENIQLFEQGHSQEAVLNIFLQLLLGLILAMAGMWMGRHL